MLINIKKPFLEIIVNINKHKRFIFFMFTELSYLNQ